MNAASKKAKELKAGTQGEVSLLVAVWKNEKKGSLMDDELEKIEKLIWFNNHLTLEQVAKLQEIANDLIKEKEVEYDVA